MKSISEFHQVVRRFRIAKDCWPKPRVRCSSTSSYLKPVCASEVILQAHVSHAARSAKLLEKSRHGPYHFMTSLVLSAPTPFPTPLAPWYTHSTLNTVSSNFVTIYRPDEQLWVNQVIPDDIPHSQPPMPTGPQHWEQQRKEWLKDCKKGVPPVNQDVYFHTHNPY